MDKPTGTEPHPDAARSGPTRPRTSPRTTTVAAVAFALVLAACGSQETAQDQAIPSPMPAPSAGIPDMGMEVGVADPSSGRSAGDVVANRSEAGRAVVRNASIELVVDDAAATIDAAEGRAVTLGGSVASSTRSRAEDGTVSGSLVLRVPADRLEELIDALDALARAVPFRSIDELDVTIQLSDIDAQLVNLRAFETELRALLAEVRERDGTVEGLVAISDSLRQVRTEIDIIESRRVQLADQVDLSTVWVSVRQARSTTPVVGTWDLPAVVRDALAATVRLGQLVVEATIWAALTVLPAVAILAVVVWAARSVLHRRRG